MKSVLLNANNDPGWESRFQVALDITRAFDSHLSCVQVVPFELLVSVDALGPTYVSPQFGDRVQELAGQHQLEVEGRLRLENVPWDWFKCDGDPPQVIIDRSGLIDLVVVSTPEGVGHNGGLGSVGAICMHVRGPVLAVPPKTKAFNPLGTALVAWNGSLAGAHAIRLSLPMLAKAETVHIVTVTDDGHGFPATDACEYLARHGVSAELQVGSCKKQALAEAMVEPAGVGDAIMETASTIGADYILAGAYGHSRFREAVFGGVTRDLLRDSEVPLLLAH